MGLFNSPVLVRVVTESGVIVMERVIPGGDTFVLTVPDSFTDEYELVRPKKRRG